MKEPTPITRLRAEFNYRKARYTMTFGVNKSDRPQRRVLISYLDYPTVMRRSDSTATHTNVLEYRAILEYFTARNYCIDACACLYRPKPADIQPGGYDVIFGFGPAFDAARKVNPQATCILYMTENPYSISYARETERINYLRDRRGIAVPLYRTGMYFRKDAERDCDAILCLGDETCYPKNIPVERIFPSAFSNPDYSPAPEKRKANAFLLFGDVGFVHKGCDLALELFSLHPEWTLYYCGTHLHKSLRRLKVELPSNIIDCGFVDASSDRYRELADTCWYQIQFSCSEASSTAVLTGMSHGLIPITMHGNGFDCLPNLVLFCADYHLDALEQALRTAVCLSDTERRALANNVFTYARKHFTLKNFSTSFATAMDRLLAPNHNK